MQRLETTVREQAQRLAVKACERVPTNMPSLSFFERNGFCYKPIDVDCGYCGQIDETSYLCKKRTYTPLAEPEDA